MPITDDAPLFVAIKEGYFKQQGLTVTPKILQQSTLAIPGLLHGTVDVVGGGNYVSFLNADASGIIKLSILASGSQCLGNTLNVLALPSSKITSAADLSGKTIAVNLTANIQTLTINAVLKANDVNPATVKFVAIPFPLMPAALKAGKIDAIAEVEPFISGAEEGDGAVSVMQQCQGPTANIPLSGYYSTQAWSQKYPKTAAAFQRAIEKGQATADSNAKLVQQLIPTFSKITPKLASIISLPNYPTTLDGTQVQRVADLMLSGGMLKNKLNVNSLLFHASGS